MRKVVVTGAAGRMGGALVRLLRASSTLALVGETGRKDDLGAVLASSGAEAVIDFTSAEASVLHARACAERGVAAVIGSTGLSVDQKGEVAKAAARVPIVLAPNTSVGVNVMFRIAADLARALGDGFDVEIVEAHHRLKKDAPSGTALRLAEGIAAALGRGDGDVRYERHGQIGARPATEIGVQTVRGGDVVGEHTVFFLGDGERLELTHRATNRDLFARGALRAAEWVIGRAPGLYDMQDVLGLSAPGVGR